MKTNIANASELGSGLIGDVAYLSESAHKNETMTFEAMKAVLHRLGFVKNFNSKKKNVDYPGILTLNLSSRSVISNISWSINEQMQESS